MKSCFLVTNSRRTTTQMLTFSLAPRKPRSVPNGSQFSTFIISIRYYFSSSSYSVNVFALDIDLDIFCLFQLLAPNVGSLFGDANDDDDDDDLFSSTKSQSSVPVFCFQFWGVWERKISVH